MLIHILKGTSSALALAFIFPLIERGDLTPETIHDDIPGTATIAEIVEAGGGGAVSSVNGKIGEVVLNADDVGAYSKIEIDTAMNVLENEIPTVASNVVRQCSWGVWDENYEVYWSPVMESGKLTYQAITNINLRANGEVNQ